MVSAVDASLFAQWVELAETLDQPLDQYLIQHNWIGTPESLFSAMRVDYRDSIVPDRALRVCLLEEVLSLCTWGTVLPFVHAYRSAWLDSTVWTPEIRDTARALHTASTRYVTDYRDRESDRYMKSALSHLCDVNQPLKTELICSCLYQDRAEKYNTGRALKYLNRQIVNAAVSYRADPTLSDHK